MNPILSSAYPNFRQLGNVRTKDGALLLPEKIFRSSDLIPKGEEAKEALEELHLDCILDLRCPLEVWERRDLTLPGTTYKNESVLRGPKYLSITVCHAGRLLCLFWMLMGKAQKIKNQKIRSYKDIPFSSAYQTAFQLMDEGKVFVFHCTEGKDRTGWLAAVIQYCLGVDEETIMEEYMKSNLCRPAKDRSWIKKLGVSEEELERGTYCESVHEELLELAWQTAEERYGSFDRYLEEVFQITPERIRKWKAYYVQEG